MPIDQGLLQQLNADNEQVTSLANAFRSNNTATKDANRELRELAALRDLIPGAIQELVEDQLGFTLERDSNDNFVAESWGKYSNDLNIHAKIIDAPAQVRAENPNLPYFTLDGRKIEVNLQLSASNSDFSPTHIQTSFDIRLQAARDLHPDDEDYQTALDQLQALFSTQGITYPKLKHHAHSSVDYDVDEADLEFDDDDSQHDEFTQLTGRDSIEKIKQDFAFLLQTNSSDRKKLSNILDRCENLLGIFVGYLAIELWRAETGQLDQIPSKAEFIEYQKKINDQLKKNISAQKRPIMFNVHKQATADLDPNISEYVIETLIPNSDESSASRGMENMMFSNDFTVHVEVVTLRVNGSTCEIVKREDKGTYNRSASKAKITYDYDPKSRKNTANYSDRDQVYQSLKLRIRQEVIEKIVRRIREGDDLADILQQNSIDVVQVHITLLSNIMSKWMGHAVVRLLSWMKNIPLLNKIYKGAKNILIDENEDEQLRFTQEAAQNLKDDDAIYLTEQDMQEIASRTAGFISADQLRHRRIKINYDYYLGNYMVNKISRFRTEMLAILNLNRTYFLEHNQLRRDKIARYIRNNVAIPQELRDELYAIFKNNPTPEINQELAAFKANKLQRYLNDSAYASNPKVKKALNDVEKIIDYYMQIEDHFSKATVLGQIRNMPIYIWGVMQRLVGVKTTTYNERTQARIPANYEAAVSEVNLAQLIGVDSIISCKSAKDRTGMFGAFYKAMLKRERLVKNIALDIKHGLIRKVNELNMPGVPGFQHRADVLQGIKDASNDDPSEVYDLIRDGHLARIGRLPKKVVNADFYDLVQQSLQEPNTSQRSFSFRSTRAFSVSPTASPRSSHRIPGSPRAASPRAASPRAASPRAASPRAPARAAPLPPGLAVSSRNMAPPPGLGPTTPPANPPTTVIPPPGFDTPPASPTGSERHSGPITFAHNSARIRPPPLPSDAAAIAPTVPRTGDGSRVAQLRNQLVAGGLNPAAAGRVQAPTSPAAATSSTRHRPPAPPTFDI
jgi:hypothetical protein